MNSCPVCGGEKVKLIRFWKKGHSIRHELTRVEPWNYELNAGEEVVTGFCSNCGIKFMAEGEGATS